MDTARKLFLSSITAFAAVLPGCQLTTMPSFFGGGPSALSSNAKPSPTQTAGQQSPVLSQPSSWFSQSSNSGASPALASTPADDQSGISGTFRKTTAAIGSALTIKPKTIPADDPVSLAGKSPTFGPDLYVEAAKMQESRGNVEGAIQQYRKAMEIAPNNVNVLLSFARLYDRQGQFDNATQLYQRAAIADPKSAKAQNDLGLCYARQHKFNESIDSLKKAIALQPEKKLYRNNLATVYVEAGNNNEALAQLTSAHGDAVAHYNLGYMLQQKGRTQEAVEQLRRAAELNPQFAEATTLLDKLSGPAVSVATYTNQIRAGLPTGAGASNGSALGFGGYSDANSPSAANVPTSPVQSQQGAFGDARVAAQPAQYAAPQATQDTQSFQGSYQPVAPVTAPATSNNAYAPPNAGSSYPSTGAYQPLGNSPNHLPPVN